MDVITVCFILQTYLIVILLATCVPPVFLLEARLNQGVLFRPAGKMSLNTQKWFHTFHFHVPSLPTHRLPLLVCLPDSPPICQQHNILLSGLNLRYRRMKLMISNTKMAAKQLLGTSLSPDLPAYRPRRTTNLLFPLSDPPSLLQQDSISPSTQSRSKRALFDFVGDLASGLFGVATQGEINTLKHHINNVYEHQQQLNNLQQKQMKLLHSYFQKTNTKVSNLYSAVRIDHEFLNNLNSQIRRNMEATENRELATIQILVRMINASETISSVQLQMQSFLNGLHALVQRKLSPSLVPESQLRKALAHVENTLRRRHPDFHVTNHHPSFYYQQQSVMYAYHDESFYVTVQIPISSRNDLFDMFQILTIPVPLNHSTTHATLLDNVPDYMAVSADRSSFVEISSIDFAMCEGRPIMTCPPLQAQRTTQHPTCAASLYLQTQTKDEYCRYRIKEDAVTPLVLEVLEGTVLLSNISEIIMTCRNQVFKKPGCMYCIYTIPCECSLMADTFQLAPRLTACKNNQDISDPIYPVNMAVLQEFFNDTDIQTILNTTFTKPLQYTIPHLRIDNHNFQQDMERASKLDADFRSIAHKMKQNQRVYRQLSSYSMNENWVPYTEPYTSISNILSLSAFALSLILLVAMLALCKRMRTLCMVLGVMTAGPPVKATPITAPTPNQISRTNLQPLALNHPKLVYQSDSKDMISTQPVPDLPTCQQPLADHFLLTIELVSLLLLLIVLLRSVTLILRTAIYRTDAVLEVSDRKTIIDIKLQSLAYCPVEYDLVMMSWITSLSLTKHFCSTDNLEISWTYFFLTTRPTGEFIYLPTTIKLSLWQSYKLRQIINSGDYVVNLKLVHGGRAVYLRRSDSDADNWENDNPDLSSNRQFLTRPTAPTDPYRFQRHYPTAGYMTEVD